MYVSMRILIVHQLIFYLINIANKLFIGRLHLSRINIIHPFDLSPGQLDHQKIVRVKIILVTK